MVVEWLKVIRMLLWWLWGRMPDVGTGRLATRE